MFIIFLHGVMYYRREALKIGSQRRGAQKRKMIFIERAKQSLSAVNQKASEARKIASALINKQSLHLSPIHALFEARMTFVLLIGEFPFNEKPKQKQNARASKAVIPKQNYRETFTSVKRRMQRLLHQINFYSFHD